MAEALEDRILAERWQNTDDPRWMLDTFIHHITQKRKLLLFCAHLCRQQEGLTSQHHKVIRMLEDYADDEMTTDDEFRKSLVGVIDNLHDPLQWESIPQSWRLIYVSVDVRNMPTTSWQGTLIGLVRSNRIKDAVFSGILRDLMYSTKAQSPPVERRLLTAEEMVADANWLGWRGSSKPAWITPEVEGLCQELYQSSDPKTGILDKDLVNLLARDMLPDAGCNERKILNHLLGIGGGSAHQLFQPARGWSLVPAHFRGCWAIDSILGRF